MGCVDANPDEEDAEYRGVRWTARVFGDCGYSFLELEVFLVFVVGPRGLICIVWLSMVSFRICCHCVVCCASSRSLDLRCGANQKVYPQCARCLEVAWLMC